MEDGGNTTTMTRTRKWTPPLEKRWRTYWKQRRAQRKLKRECREDRRKAARQSAET